MYPRMSERDELVIITFSPALLGVYARPISSGRYEPISLSDVMWDERVAAALDGPMFSNCAPGTTYATSYCADPRFAQLDQSVGVSDPPNQGNESKGVSVSIVDDLAIWSLGGAFDSRATVGVQMFPTLVADGAVQTVSTTGADAERVRRVALAGLPDGRLAFVYGTDSLAGFARRCRDAGFIWAGYTDGGGSTSMGYRDPETENVRRWGPSQQNERRVAIFLVARKPTDPVIEAAKTAGIGLAIGVGTLGATALGLWAYSRYRNR